MKLPFVGGHGNSRQLFIYYSVENKTYRIIVMYYENNLKEIENLLIMKNETPPSLFTKLPLHNKISRPQILISDFIKTTVKLISNEQFWTELKKLYEYYNLVITTTDEFSKMWNLYAIHQAGGGSKKKKSIKKNTKK